MLTTRAIVPCSNGTASQSHLGDTDPFSLTATHTSDEIIADLGVASMREAEDVHHDCSHVVGKFFSGCV